MRVDSACASVSSRRKFLVVFVSAVRPPARSWTTKVVTLIIPRHTRMQKSIRLLLHHSVPGNPRGWWVAGGGWRDGAAAGVFQIITSGCGGGGSPWQPQCLQHPTTEGNRATERRNPVLLLRTLESECAREWKRFPRTSANSAFAPRR